MQDEGFGADKQNSQIENFPQLSDMFDEVYQELGNKAEVNYWMPYSQLITECMESRQRASITQKQLADIMKTKQSVISRFENMGRLPSYDFIARLAFALGHNLGMTLYGDFMAVVPCSMQDKIKAKAAELNLPTREFLQQTLEKALQPISWEVLLSTSQLPASFFTNGKCNNAIPFCSPNSSDNPLQESKMIGHHNSIEATTPRNTFPFIPFSPLSNLQPVADCESLQCCNE